MYSNIIVENIREEFIMAYKVTKKQVKEMSNVELLLNFEQCIT